MYVLAILLKILEITKETFIYNYNENKYTNIDSQILAVKYFSQIEK